LKNKRVYAVFKPKSLIHLPPKFIKYIGRRDWFIYNGRKIALYDGDAWFFPYNIPKKNILKYKKGWKKTYRPEDPQNFKFSYCFEEDLQILLE